MKQAKEIAWHVEEAISFPRKEFLSCRLPAPTCTCEAQQEGRVRVIRRKLLLQISRWIRDQEVSWRAVLPKNHDLSISWPYHSANLFNFHFSLLAILCLFLLLPSSFFACAALPSFCHLLLWSQQICPVSLYIIL
ncbi:hypothetical protein K443DRAFT_472121 [Laccaria amethystina LaAM-08-1]|uniref:Uncharacterized protein n=1 Tax=Laccaria amethystina LaAM-08-1 TaxID=1095629 RepID=A0A0C9Y0K8_9AGAR|nr:hypothetical protein K443DRAFT_472121 [Laccaria amethystina LaAM-08-1]